MPIIDKLPLTFSRAALLNARLCTRLLANCVSDKKNIQISEDDFYFILFYFILFYFILFYFILFYFILFYFIFHFFAVLLRYRLNVHLGVQETQVEHIGQTTLGTITFRLT